MHPLANFIRYLPLPVTAFQAVACASLIFFYLPLSKAADYELLANFAQAGSYPNAAILSHTNGNAYGTTVSGGDFDKGTVFQIAPDGTLTTLHSFNGSDGQSPISSLTLGSDGALYGSTEEGGSLGFGTLYKVNTAGIYTSLVNFTGTTGAAPGSVPAGLTAHPNGDLYGLTQAGGANGHGTVFRLTSSGQLTTLLHFTGSAGSAPGSQPVASLTLVGSDLYGLTRSGGASDAGVLFRLSPTGAYTQLGAFTGAAGNQAGNAPRAPLLAHSDGKLYGSTEFGGAFGLGLIFSVTTNGSNYTVLHAFDDTTGSKPSGPLAEAADTSIWGTTATGGTEGLGTLFSITSNGNLTTRSHFSGTTGPTLGASPLSGLTLSSSNTFLGATSAGGPGNNGLVFEIDTSANYAVIARFTTDLGWAPSGPPSLSPQNELLFPLALGGSTGNGTIAQILNTGAAQLKATNPDEVGAIPLGSLTTWGANTLGNTTRQGATGRGSAFLLDANATLTSLSDFTSTAGENVSGPLLPNTNIVYGVSQAGGLSNHGTLFQIATDGTLTRTFSFSGTTGTRKGDRPQAPLALLPDGSLYGLTQNGGAANLGTLFKLAPDGTFSTLIEFDSNSPQKPSSGLTLAPDGKLYGCSAQGGTSNLGALFSFDPITSALTTEASFTFTGHTPVGPLSLGSDGALYGIASQGGNGFGAAFRYLPGSPIEILATFTGASGNAPGIPTRTVATGVEIHGGLTLAPDGAIYGTLPAGGPRGGGILFRINTLTPLQKWKQANLGDANAQESDDPDHDGLPTLIEYALGSLPQTPDNPGAISVTIDNNHLAIGFQRNANRSDIKIFVEASTSPLGPWSPIATSDFGNPFTGNASIEETLLNENRTQTRIIHNTAIEQTQSSFIRLRVTH